MKKILFTLAALLMLSSTVMAEEQPIASAIDEAIQADKPVQGIDIEKSGAVFVIQKQPQKETSVQYVKVSKCGLVAIININGKVKDADTEK